MKERWSSDGTSIKKNIINPIPAYNNHIETETIQELESLKDSHLDLFMEGLTIRERILGRQNPELTHCIIYRGAVFADEVGIFYGCVYQVNNSYIDFILSREISNPALNSGCTVFHSSIPQKPGN